MKLFSRFMSYAEFEELFEGQPFDRADYWTYCFEDISEINNEEHEETEYALIGTPYGCSKFRIAELPYNPDPFTDGVEELSEMQAESLIDALDGCYWTEELAESFNEVMENADIWDEVKLCFECGKLSFDGYIDCEGRFYCSDACVLVDYPEWEEASNRFDELLTLYEVEELEEEHLKESDWDLIYYDDTGALMPCGIYYTDWT